MSRSRRAKSAVRLPFPSAKVNLRAACCSAAVLRSRLLGLLCCRLRMASGRRSAFSNQLRFSLAEQAAQAARRDVTASARSSNLSGSGCAAKAIKNFSMPSSPRKAGSKKYGLRSFQIGRKSASTDPSSYHLRAVVLRILAGLNCAACKLHLNVTLSSLLQRLKILAISCRLVPITSSLRLGVTGSRPPAVVYIKTRKP